jgi:glycosyltransferase involved in cell wall biosynthesis
MGKRKHIALIFSYDENWIAGTYYILNLGCALNTLPDEQKPEITILASKKKEFDYFTCETKYPYLHFIKKNKFHLQIKKNGIVVSNKYQFVKEFICLLFKILLYFRRKTNSRLLNEFDMIFPNPDSYIFELINKEKKVYWIPDFQEDYLKEFFSTQEIVQRKQTQIAMALLIDKLVFSSCDAKNDFNRLYPFATSKQYVLPFAVTHPNYEVIDLDEIKQKYNIKKNYFYTPNQFWAHKNHQIVIEAVELLKKEINDILVIFSGKDNDNRTALSFADELKNLVKEKDLEENILFLGFIDRKEQLCLMKNAIAIIQPSLFEGWSTVVEDAKAMNQFVIASDLRVHKEQLNQNVFFFNPKDKYSLADSMLKTLNGNIEKHDNNYTESVKLFAENFINIV